MKKRSLALGILLGIAVVVSLGIVYIDNIKHYFITAGGLTQFFVNTNYVFGVDTNTGRIGFGVTNTTVYLQVVGKKPATNALGNGTSAAASGRIDIVGGNGGDTFAPTSASGGAGGLITLTGGTGGEAPLATTNNTGGTGGTVLIIAGTGGGGNVTGVATNANTGGTGGSVAINGGTGGVPTSPATNTVSGNGGGFTAAAGDSASPSAGWARKTGTGGSVSFTAGVSGNSTRTNSGNGGSVTFTAGNSGNVLTTPGNSGMPGAISLNAGNAGSAAAGGNPSPGANVSINGGNGSTGDTNSNGGRVHIVGGVPGSGAVAGDVVVARASDGSSRGGLMVGPILGGAASVTNILGGSASLDFGSVAAGAVEDLPIAVTGVTSNNCAVSLSVPWESASGGGAFVTFNSNDVIYVRFVNNQLVAAIDPTPGTFTVVAFRIR